MTQLAPYIMDIVEFRQRMDLGSGNADAVTAMLLVVGTMWEMETANYWIPRTGIAATWNPERREKLLFTYAAPVANLTLSEWWDSDGPSKSVVVDTGDYYLSLDTGEIRRTRNNSWRHMVTGTYDAPGVAASALSELIKQALVYQAKFLLNRNETKKIDVRTQSFDKNSTSYMNPDYHPFFWATLQNHKRRIYGAVG